MSHSSVNDIHSNSFISVNSYGNLTSPSPYLLNQKISREGLLCKGLPPLKRSSPETGITNSLNPIQTKTRNKILPKINEYVTFFMFT